ncbi:MAG: NERD domain-containing protein [Candidatus Nanopelagicales bacterium]
MAGFVWPEYPDFAAESERRVFDALRRDLRDGDALLYGLRFTDSTHGDIEIDFTVFLKDVGVAVIEVKGGRVAYANGEWTSTSATDTHVIHPTDQARKCRYALRKALEKSDRWSRGALRDGWMIALPDTEVHDESILAPDSPIELVIGRNHLGQALGRIIDHLNDQHDLRPLSAPGWIDSALDILLRRGEPQRDIIADAARHTDHVERLTREQGDVLDMVAGNQYLEVRGGAGTGKSWLAAEQARRWTAQGKRVALLSFGRGLAETFQAQFESTRRQHKPAFIGTFHQLGAHWDVVAAQNAPSIWWTETAPELMTAAAHSLASGHQFDALVVDEAQDFADNWWIPLLTVLRDPGTARIATFRDDNQAVFGRLGRPDIAVARVTLTKNLRNTRQIGDAFAPLVDNRPQLLGGNGAPVTFIGCATNDVIACADDAAVALLDEGWEPRDVALLTTQHRHPVQVEQQSGDYGSYWKNLWSGDDIFYGTAAGFKGLERPAVVVAVDGFREGVNPRELLYVAMSRARDKLVVVGDPDVLRALGVG